MSRIEGRGGKMYSFWAMYSFRMSFWSVPPTLDQGVPCFSATARYMASAIGAVELMVMEVVTAPEVDAVEEDLHVRERVDGDAALADFAPRHLVVRVVAVEGRQVERRREAASGRARGDSGTARSSAAPCRTRRTGASSRACRGTSSGGRRACTGNSPGPAEVALRVETGQRVRTGERLDRSAGDRREIAPPSDLAVEGLAAGFLPAPPALAGRRGDSRVVALVSAHRSSSSKTAG